MTGVTSQQLSRPGRYSKLGFVYCVRFIGTGKVKIGTTSDPVGRMRALRSFSPHEVEWAHLLWVGTQGEGAVWEHEVMAHLSDWAEHGEWFSDGPQVADAFGLIAPALDVAIDFPAPEFRKPRHRQPMDDRRLSCALLAAKYKSLSGSHWPATDLGLATQLSAVPTKATYDDGFETRAEALIAALPDVTWPATSGDAA